MQQFTTVRHFLGNSEILLLKMASQMPACDKSYKEEQFMFFRSGFTFRDNKHGNVGDIIKICFDGLLWTW